VPIVATVLVAVLVAGLAGVLVAVFVAVLAALLAAVMVAVAPVTVTRSVSILATSCHFLRYWRPYCAASLLLGTQSIGTHLASFSKHVSPCPAKRRGVGPGLGECRHPTVRAEIRSANNDSRDIRLDLHRRE